MRRSWGVIASAVLAVALEVAINLVASSIAMPRKYYLAPIVAFVVLVGLQLVIASRDQQAPAHSSQRSIGGRHLIKGEWHEPSRLTVLVILEVASLCLMFGALSLLTIHTTRKGLLITTLCFIVLLAALCLRVALGSRINLEFSTSGVTIRWGVGRKRRLRWDEARNFHAERNYFVAKPVSASTWYLHGWEFDDRDNVIRICDLCRAGIPAAAVNAAVAYWSKIRADS